MREEEATAGTPDAMALAEARQGKRDVSAAVAFAVAPIPVAVGQAVSHVLSYGGDPQGFDPLRFYWPACAVLAVVQVVAGIAWIASLGPQSGWPRLAIRPRTFWWLLALFVLLLNLLAAAVPFLGDGPWLIAGIIVMTIPALLPSVILAAAFGALAFWMLRRGGVARQTGRERGGGPPATPSAAAGTSRE